MCLIYYVVANNRYLAGERYFFNSFDMLGKPTFISEAYIKNNPSTVMLFGTREQAEEAVRDIKLRKPDINPVIHNIWDGNAWKAADGSELNDGT